MVSPGAVPTPDLFEAFFDLAQMGGILFKPVLEAGNIIDFAYVRLNPAAQRMLALPERPLETFLTRYPHAKPTGIFTFYRDAYLSEETHHGEFNYQHDGLDNYFYLAARRAGEQLLVSFTDISKQPRTAVEEALRASQAREHKTRAEAERQRGELQRLFEQSPVAMALFRGPDYIIELANEPMAAIWGRSLAQVLGQPVFEALSYVKNQGFEAIFADVLAQGTPYNLHELPVTIDRVHLGQPALGYFNLTYRPQYDAQGHITGIITSAHEVTEQVLARRQVEQLNQELEARMQERTQQLAASQAATERQRQQWEELFWRAPAAICIFDGPGWVYEFVNPRYQAMFPGRELLGKRLVDALPEVADQPLMGILHRVYDTGEPFEEREVLVPLARTEGGPVEDIYFDLTYLARYNEQGQIDGFVTYAYDVTQQVLAQREREARQGEQELARQRVQHLNEELAAINEELTATNEELHTSNTQLTRTNTDLDTFVYTASHDLKAPITNIEGILNALRDILPAEVQQDDVVAHLLGLLDHTVGRFLTTIFQLTDLTRLQRTFDEPAELLALVPVVAGVVADLAPAIEEASAQLHLAVPAGLHVSFAPASLRSIVYNLLSNALKYRDPTRPAQVWLRTEAQPGAIVLTVRDNGLGLTDSQQQRLFGVFQRLHTHVEGTGVGLYMIKRLIENAGAAITVTSAPGVGTTFTVTFPA